MLELRTGRTTEDADEEKQAIKNVAQKATLNSEKRRVLNSPLSV